MEYRKIIILHKSNVFYNNLLSNQIQLKTKQLYSQITNVNFIYYNNNKQRGLLAQGDSKPKDTYQFRVNSRLIMFSD